MLVRLKRRPLSSFSSPGNSAAQLAMFIAGDVGTPTDRYQPNFGEVQPPRSEPTLLPPSAEAPLATVEERHAKPERPPATTEWIWGRSDDETRVNSITSLLLDLLCSKLPAMAMKVTQCPTKKMMITVIILSLSAPFPYPNNQRRAPTPTVIYSEIRPSSSRC